ncbi:MAG: hypothetical protein V4654_03050 [Bdellovibrionota bacterium]
MAIVLFSGGKFNLNRAGYSLTGLVSGLALTSIVALAAGYVSMQTKTIEVRHDLQSSLDQAHILSLQKSRSTASIKRFLNLNSVDSSANLNPGTINTALLNCLSGNGFNCTSYSNFTEINADHFSSRSTCAIGENCVISSQISYRGVCDAISCSSIDVRISSNISGIDSNKYSFQQRLTTVNYPRLVFSGKANINFSCANTGVIIGINLQNLRAICGTAAANNCTNDAPLSNYNLSSTSGGSNCPGLVSNTCARGTGRLGLFAGQGLCN